ncbi:hypothetical protein RF11_01510 [Thelohanellus kitauei]|uniref:Uncharacterized protein n=1 Tax=Thelohanellus kitauei TaxID=669202 RepID=A0A0C2IZD3_THEKT|nr:hypothetical protein RF11_01510 [Thelohanellus kitauei]
MDAKKNLKSGRSKKDPGLTKIPPAHVKSQNTPKFIRSNLPQKSSTCVCSNHQTINTTVTCSNPQPKSIGALNSSPCSKTPYISSNVNPPNSNSILSDLLIRYGESNPSRIIQQINSLSKIMKINDPKALKRSIMSKTSPTSKKPNPHPEPPELETSLFSIFDDIICDPSLNLNSTAPDYSDDEILRLNSHRVKEETKKLSYLDYDPDNFFEDDYT